MKIVIVGAGALGAYFGGRWQEAGTQVTFLVRKKRAKQLQEQGLSIMSVHGDYAFQNLNFVEDVHDIDEVDLILLAVKGHHLPESLPALRYLTRKGAKILPLLNGIEHITILQEALGDETIIGGVSFIISTLNEKGHVLQTSEQHDLVFGPLHPSQQQLCSQLEQISATARFNSVMTNSVSKALWKKYMFISAFSGMTTATNYPIGNIRSHPATFALTREVLTEMKQLANAYDIALTDKHVDQAVAQLESLPEAATSSMHQDRRKGLTLEVEHLQGGAIRLAEKAGIELPVIKTLYAIIKPSENNQ